MNTILNQEPRLRMSRAEAARYYRPAELCELLCISRATLNRWAKSHPGFPRKINIDTSGRGPCIRYLRSEVHEYLDRVESACIAAE